MPVRVLYLSLSALSKQRIILLKLTLQLPLFILWQLILGCGWSYGQEASWLHLPGAIRPDARLMELKQDEFSFVSTGEDNVKTQDLVRWGRWSGIIGQQAIWLNDGSWLAGQIHQCDTNSISLHHRWLELNHLPLHSIRAVIYSPLASLHEWIAVSRQLQQLQGDNDTIWLRDGSRLSGILEWTSSGEDFAQPIQLKVDRQTITVAWSDISVLAMSPALVGPLPDNRSATVIGLEDGSLLNVNSIKPSARSSELELLSLGVVPTLDAPEEFVRVIRYLDRKEVTGVSRAGDVPPLSYKFLPDSELTFSLGVNQTVYGQPLVVGRRAQAGVIRHGLAMHSSAQVAYRWDQSPGKFLAEVCLAEADGDSLVLGDTVCKVLLGKGRELTTAAEFSLTSQPERTGPKLVEVDITNAQLVVLVVEKSRFGQWGDQVFWLDARFTRN